MKIIKQGVLPKKVKGIYRGECKNCHCVVQVDKDETLNDQDVNPYIHCPTPKCRNWINLSLFNP